MNQSGWEYRGIGGEHAVKSRVQSSDFGVVSIHKVLIYLTSGDLIALGVYTRTPVDGFIVPLEQWKSINVALVFPVVVNKWWTSSSLRNSKQNGGHKVKDYYCFKFVSTFPVLLGCISNPTMVAFSLGDNSFRLVFLHKYWKITSPFEFFFVDLKSYILDLIPKRIRFRTYPAVETIYHTSATNNEQKIYQFSIKRSLRFELIS